MADRSPALNAAPTRADNEAVTRVIAQIFLWLVFYIHYETVFAPGTLHSWALIGGFLLVAPAILNRFIETGFRLPYDYALVAFMGVVMLVGFIASLGGATALQLQAYCLALATYVFIREAMPTLSMQWFSRMMITFLLINSGLIILQFWTGSYFVSRSLAATETPLLLPSGVSDGPTKNGMLHSFALAFVFGRVTWVPKRAMWELGLLVFGIGALILSGSRAGLVAFMLAAIGTTGMRIRIRRVSGLSRRGISWKIIGSLALVLVLIVRGIMAIPEMVNRMDVNYAAKVLAYKLALSDNTDATVEGGSVQTRFYQVKRALSRMADNPLQVVGIGFGAGAFEASEGLNVHNSYVEFLYEMGLAAWIALAALTAWAIRGALRQQDVVLVMPILAGLISVMAFMGFHDVLRGRVFWIPLGMLAGLAVSPRKRKLDS